MPRIWTTCPKCQRPLDTESEQDEQFIHCPGCDAEVPIPKPILMRVPNFVWVAAFLVMLIPLSSIPGFASYYSNWRMLGPAVFLVCLMGIPGYFLVRGNSATWTIVLVAASLICLVSLLLCLYGVAIYVFSPNWKDFILMGVFPLINSAGLITVLLLVPVREWCQH